MSNGRNTFISFEVIFDFLTLDNLDNLGYTFIYLFFRLLRKFPTSSLMVESCLVLYPPFKKVFMSVFTSFFPQITIIGRSQACSRTTNTQEAGLVLRSDTSHKVLMGPFLITLAVFLVQKVHRNCRNHQHFKII